MAAEQTPFKRIASDFLDNPVAVFGLVLFGLILLTAILAPLEAEWVKGPGVLVRPI